MKNLIKKISITLLVVQALSVNGSTFVFAEEVDFSQFESTNWSQGVGANPNFTIDNNYSPYTPVDFTQFNNTSFTDGSNYTGTYTNTISNNGANPNFTIDNNYSPYTPVDFTQFNNTSFTDGSNYTGTYNCTNCDITGATPYTPTITNDLAVPYTPTVDVSSPWITSTYPSYSNIGATYSWTTPTYSYTNPVYTSPVYTTPNYPVGNSCDTANNYYSNGSVCVKQCQNAGSVVYPAQCPLAPTPNPITCDTANNYYSNGSVCVKNCNYGGTVIYPNTCPNYIPPVIPNPVVQTCDTVNNYYYNNSACVKYCSSTNGYVTYPNTCPNYFPVPTPNPVQTQVCYNGSIISAFSVCPSHLKTCNDGSVVSINSLCPQVLRVLPQITVNNVITSIPTQVANTSARCNGIGLIANNLQTVAWFEYGTTQNLGSKTAVANIGSLTTSPFTNLLKGLTPHTDYYCRAVMANQLGTIKGDIVHFTTKSTVVYYPTIVKKVVAKKTVSKVEPIKKEILCSDGTKIESVGKEGDSINSAEAMLETGAKALSLTLTKTKGEVSPNQVVDYFLAFKNESTSNITDVSIVLTLPEEMTLLKSTKGSYDVRTRELTIAFPVVTSLQSGSVEIEVGVAKESIIGKSLAVQAHASYDLPPVTKNGKILHDENVAFAVSTISSAPVALDSKSPATEKKTVDTPKETTSFFPNTVVEWVALFAIFLIIIILVRTIREAYKGEKSGH